MRFVIATDVPLPSHAEGFPLGPEVCSACWGAGMAVRRYDEKRGREVADLNVSCPQCGRTGDGKKIVTRQA